MERFNKSKYRYIEKIIIILVISMILSGILSFYDGEINAENNVKSSHIVMESYSKRVLLGDNINKRLPMASTTKIMTALVACESGKLEDKITITKDMVGIEGSSIYLEEGEILTIEELLYGLMLRSGNDSAVAIAIGIAGSIDSFVNLMNAKADELSLANTNFVNPHGLHDDNHYTSAYDLALIASCAMANEEFSRIVGTKSKVIGGETSNKRYLVNKNKMLSLYDGASGIKTGFTKKSGRCLVSSAKRDNMQLIAVVLNEPNMWEYSISSLDRAFGEYTLLDITTKDSPIDAINIGSKEYQICTHNTLKYPIKDSERRSLSYEIQIDDNIKKCSHGSKIGNILVYHDKHLIFKEKIYTI